MLSGISPSFERLSQAERQVVYVLLTRAPLYSPPERGFLVQLACVKHAASVRSEPGSNSWFDFPIRTDPQRRLEPPKKTGPITGLRILQL